MRNLILATLPLVFALGCGDKEEDTGSEEVAEDTAAEEAEEAEEVEEVDTGASE